MAFRVQFLADLYPHRLGSLFIIRVFKDVTFISFVI